MGLHRLTSIVVGVPDVAGTAAVDRDVGLSETRPGVFASILRLSSLDGRSTLGRNAPRRQAPIIHVQDELISSTLRSCESFRPSPSCGPSRPRRVI